MAYKRHYELSGYQNPMLKISVSAEDPENIKDPEAALRKLAHNYGYTLPEKFDIIHRFAKNLWNTVKDEKGIWIYEINIPMKDTGHESDNYYGNEED